MAVLFKGCHKVLSQKGQSLLRDDFNEKSWQNVWIIQKLFVTL